jgi:hypothetical protein
MKSSAKRHISVILNVVSRPNNIDPGSPYIRFTFPNDSFSSDPAFDLPRTNSIPFIEDISEESSRIVWATPDYEGFSEVSFACACFSDELAACVGPSINHRQSVLTMWPYHVANSQPSSYPFTYQVSFDSMQVGTHSAWILSGSTLSPLCFGRYESVIATRIE